MKAAQLKISRFGSAVNEGQTTTLLVEFEDGTLGQISFPATQNGALIQRIQNAFLPSDRREAVELEVLQIEPARNSKDELVLKIDTAQAHTLFCSVPRNQAELLQERIEDFDRLPLFDWAADN